MHYQSSHDTARFCHFLYLLDGLINPSNVVPTRTSAFGRPLDFPLPTLFILLGLKFDSGPGYRTFVAQLEFNPLLLERLGLSRAPSYSILQQTLKRLDTQLLHRMYRLLTRERPPPRNIAVDSTGFSYSTGGEWVSVSLQKPRKRRFHALHDAVDSDTLTIHMAGF